VFGKKIAQQCTVTFSKVSFWRQYTNNLQFFVELITYITAFPLFFINKAHTKSNASSKRGKNSGICLFVVCFLASTVCLLRVLLLLRFLKLKKAF
jgi:hypothetical protein